jgi:isoleucyl-tRNA synthetase
MIETGRTGASRASAPGACRSPSSSNKKTGEPLRDQAVIDRIADAFDEGRRRRLVSLAPSRFLGNDYNPDDYEQVKDIVDVWFDSARPMPSCWSRAPTRPGTCMAGRSLYLEGSDQHRGWFHSSLLESLRHARPRALRGRCSPTASSLDEQGRKMSKSLGNVVAPQKVMEQYGADILRLWVVSRRLCRDLRIGPRS